jgi:DNA-3-methyladenine glycosylase
MWSRPGRAFIYNVHKYWMFNIVAHRPKETGAVLIRAIEPTEGIRVLKRNRAVENVFELTNGPGKLTVALMIDKSLNSVPVTSFESEVFVANNRMEFTVGRSHRIGVRRDLSRKLRCFIEGNKFVSK